MPRWPRSEYLDANGHGSIILDFIDIVITEYKCRVLGLLNTEGLISSLCI